MYWNVNLTFSYFTFLLAFQDGWHSLDSLQRLCTLEAKLALLLRISHSYEKFGGQILISMGVLEHLRSCRVVDLQMKVLLAYNPSLFLLIGSNNANFHQRSMRSSDYKSVRDSTTVNEKLRLVLSPALRLVSSLTSLVALSELFEVLFHSLPLLLL